MRCTCLALFRWLIIVDQFPIDARPSLVDTDSRFDSFSAATYMYIHHFVLDVILANISVLSTLLQQLGSSIGLVFLETRGYSGRAILKAVQLSTLWSSNSLRELCCGGAAQKGVAASLIWGRRWENVHALQRSRYTEHSCCQEWLSTHIGLKIPVHAHDG